MCLILSVLRLLRFCGGLFVLGVLVVGNFLVRFGLNDGEWFLKIVMLYSVGSLFGLVVV